MTELSGGRRKRPMRPVWITALGLFCSLSLTLLIFYRDVDNPSLFPSNVLLLGLISINVSLVVVLVLLLSRNLVKLYFERRHRLLGAGLRAKLVAAFISFTLIPTVVLFIVASGLISSSIENWFGIPIEQALKDSVDVAKDYYTSTKTRDELLGRTISEQSARHTTTAQEQQALLDQFFADPNKRLGVAGVSIVTQNGAALASASFGPPDHGTGGAAGPARTRKAETAGTSSPGPDQMIQLLANANRGQVSSATFSVDQGDLLRTAVPVMGTGGSTSMIVLVDSIIPIGMMQKLDEINQASEDYRQIKAFKTPIKGIYVVLFLAVSLLIIFAATWFGFYIARGITGPIQKLLEGTRAVAAGNLAARVETESTDELTELVDSFNVMTDDLRNSKSALEAVNQSLRFSNLELEQRRAYIETVLETMAAGVIATDQRGAITTFNRSAETILGISGRSVKDRHHEAVFKEFHLEPLTDDLRRLMRHNGDTAERELSAELQGRALTLHFSMSLLRGPDRTPLGAVLVFDDLSELMKAQKLAAWQEVARRIAHEIKNPLTPILLATERLRKRFLQPADDFPTVFDESTRTIINEVNAMKTMVDEFSNFARMPAPSPVPCDLHALLGEILALYRNAHKDVTIVTEFAESLPPLMLDSAQMKQVFINLFENAIAAMNGRGRLWVTTTYAPGQPSVRVAVADDGSGVPAEDLDKLFLPYFSKRRGGSGLGLAIVQRIITDHNGHITARPNQPKGTVMLIDLPTPTLP